MPGWTRAVALVGLLAGCAELEAEPFVAGPSGAGPGASGGAASGRGGTAAIGGAASGPGGAAAIGGAAAGPGGAAAPYPGEGAPLERTPTPCLDGIAPRDDAVKPVTLAGGAGAAGFDVDGEPSTGITVFDRSGSMFASWSTAEELPEGEATDAVFNLDFARPRSRLTGASRFTVRAA